MRPDAEFKLARRLRAVRILQLEDDPVYAELVRRNLAVLHQAEIIECVGTLAAAQRRLDAGGVDLVITDLNLPDSKGLDTLEGLTRVTDRPIIVLTGERIEGLLELALEYGAYDVIEKDRIDQVQLERLVRLAATHAKTFRSLRDSEARFRSLTELSSDWYWEQDEQFRFTEVSGIGMYASRGRERRADLGKTRWEIPGFEPLHGDWSEHRRQLERHEPFQDLVVRYPESDATRFVSVTGEPVFAPDGSFKGYRGVSKDVTDRVLAEEAARRVGRMYAALSAINEAIQRATSVEALLHKTCEITVGSGSFQRAIVRIADWSSGLLALAALAGRDSETVRAARIPIPQPGAQEGSVAACAFSSGRPLVVRDVHTDPKAGGLTPLAAAMPEVVSVGAFPLRRGGVCVGVLLLHGTGADSFDGEMTPLIQRVAANLSFALESMDGDARRLETEAALRDSEARFRSLVELSSDWYWETDAELRYTGIRGDGLFDDPAALIGMRREDLPGIQFESEEWRPYREAVAARRPFRDFVYRRVLPSGEERYVNLSGEAVFDAGGRFAGYRGVGMDVTASMRAGEDLRRFRVAMDASADMILLADRATMRYVDVNATACELLGYAREELLSMGPQDLTPFSREELERVYDAAIENPSVPGGMKSWLRRKDGSRLPFESRRKLLRSGDTWLVAAVCRDVSERLAAEEALRASEARFRSLVELSSDWYWEQDENFRFVEQIGDRLRNQAARPQRFVGLTRWEAHAGSLTPDQWAAHRATLEAHLPFHDFAYERASADGARRWISISGAPIFDEAGRFAGYRGVGKDITDRKRAEQLQALEQLVSRGLSEANDAGEALKATIRAVCETERWECGRYFGVDEKAGVMRFVESWGIADPAIQKFIERSRELVYQPGTGLMGRVWQSGQPLWVADVAKDDRAQRGAFLDGLGIRGAFVFALKSEGRTIGTLAFNSRETRQPEQRLLEAIHLIGNQIGQFLGRKRAEEEQQASRRLLDNIVENIPTAVQLKSVQNGYRMVMWNKAAEAVYGLPRAEVIGRNVHDLWSKENADRMHASDCELIETGGIQDFPDRIAQTRDRGAIRVHMRKVPLYDAAGKPSHLLVIADDMTERLADEARVRESEARFRSLTGLSSDWYWEQDAAFRFTKITGAGAAPMSNGGDAGRYLGKIRMEIEDLQPLEGDWADHRAVLERHEAFRDVVFRRRMADGSDRYMSVGGEPIFDATGHFQGYRGIGKDVTLRMREERLVRLEHSVARHLAEASSRSDALKRVMQAICESERWECGRYFALDAAGAAMQFEQAWAADIPAMRRFAESSRTVSFRKGEGLIGIVWRDAEPLWTEDTSTDGRVALKGLAAQAGLHGSFVFPVALEGRVIGVLSISSREVRKPDERLLQTMGVIGSQIGQFLRRKQGENAMREHGARLASIVDLQGQLAAEDLDVEGISRLLAEKAREVIGTGIAAVQYVDGEGFRYAAATGGGLHLVGVTTPLTGNFSGAVVASGKAIYCEDTQTDPRVNPAAALRAGARSLIGAPLEHEGRVIGVLKVMSSEVRAFTDEQLGLLQLLAGIGGSAIQRRRSELEMRRFRMAMDASVDAIYLTDPTAMRFVDVNAAACVRTGYSREELLRMGPHDLIDADREQIRAEFEDVIAAGEQGLRNDRQSTMRDGRKLWTELNRKVLRSGAELLIVTVARDITGRKLAEERQAAHARYQEKIARFGESALGRRDASELLEDALGAIAEGLPGCAVAYLEPHAKERTLVVRAATGLPAGTPATGGAYAATDSIALPIEHGELAIVDRTEETPPALPFEWAREFRCAALIPVHGDNRALGALCLLSRKPGVCGVEESKFLVTAASVLSAGLRRIDSEGRLAFLAQFDGLTGLPNRALLADRFSQMIVQARRRDKPLGVLFIDLDDFKLVNDSLGHAGGDELLREVAGRLQASVRSGDTVARISGDEFAVILNDLARADDAALVAQKIINCLSAPVAVGGRELFVTASIGIAAFPSDGADAEALLGAADAAMYRAKQAGRNGYQFFTADINQRTRARAQLGSELRRALERDEFVLAYQPKVDLRSGVACAAEALLRWRHPERGIVSPAEFIPVLEETGLIMPVGEWVLAQVCRDIKAWEAVGLLPFPVAVNLSARQFRHADLDDRIRAVVRKYGVDPKLIELEVTESQVMQDPEHANRVMRALSADGIRVAIDDFGTGYSSLSYLTRFPVAALKIDRSFVADVLEDPADATIVRTIVDMAHTLGFIVVAEGVETEAQAAFLRGLGCEQAQGYHFARPMPEAELRALLSPREDRRRALAPAPRAARS